MNLKKIKDGKPKLNLGGALTGSLFQGNPTKQNAEEFKKIIEGNAAKMISIGKVKVKGNICLGVQVKLPASVNIDSSSTPVELIGARREDNDLIGYYVPKGGWKKANQAEDLK